MLLPSPPKAMEGVAQLIVLLFAAAAAASPLNCSVTNSDNSLFRYKISEKPSSPKCTTSWEYRNGTVIVDILGKHDVHLVMNHTPHSVDLKDCKDFLLHKRECDGVLVEVSCSVNCSLFVVKGHLPSRICLSLNICTDLWTFGVSIAAIAAIAAVLLLLLWMIWKWGTGGCRCVPRNYTPPTDQEQVQIEMEGKGTIKIPQ